ncbi:MAG: SDR family NAD(P)-dependent oxidoreductase, partial [Leptospiraceae bacterium]|nr:SDR family NAD(P)-dependent oxidoreductase [Leptospiraceae bacterium]
MITIQEHIQLSENLEKVFSVVGNFQFLKEWDPGIKRVEKISQGKLKVGTEFMIYVDFFFKEIPMKYTLIEFTENEKCVYRGETDDISVVDTIEFSEKKEGCVVHYRAEFTLKNSPSFLEPVFEKLLENTANNAFEGMRNAFNQSRIIKEGSLNKYTYKLLLPIVYDFSKMGYHNCKKEFRALSSNLSGKTAIITGATAGIGYESSLFLASRGARLILVGRDENKLNSTKNSIIQNTGNSEIFIERAELTLMN